MTPFAWFGAVLAVLIALAVLAVSIGLAADTLQNLWDRWQHRHEELVIRRIGTRLVQECYWLSENDAAMHALEAAGAAMRASGAWNIDAVRERWRELQATER